MAYDYDWDGTIYYNDVVVPLQHEVKALRTRIAELERERDEALTNRHDLHQDLLKDAMDDQEQIERLRAELSQARADERERCARVAEGFSRFNAAQEFADAPKLVAAAIRSLT